MTDLVELEHVEQFLTALGCEVTPWGKKAGLRAVRPVTGETIVSYFRVSSAPHPPIPRTDLDAFAGIKQQEPHASFRLITTFQPPADLVSRLERDRIRVTSLAGYFSDVINSRFLAEKTIGEADKYIPEDKYVEQRIKGQSQRADSFILESWISRRNGADDASPPLLVVLAPAGHGKTCLAYHLARKFAKEHLQDENAPIPVLMPLHRHRTVKQFDELVLTHLQDLQIHGFTSDAFACMANLGLIIPILDGFDELAETGGLRVARQTLSALLDEFRGNARAILTSRQSFFRHRGDIEARKGNEDSFSTIELEPFNQEERKTFFLAYGVSPDRLNLHEELISRISRDQEVIGSPLMLWTVAEAARGKGEADLRTDLSGAELFNFCVQRICERELGRQPRPLPPEKQIALMTFLAEIMFEADSYTLDDWESWLRDMAAQDLPSGLSEDEVDSELERRMQILKDHAFLQVQAATKSGKPSPISFVHPVFRDYLIAADIAKAVAEAKLSVLTRKSLPQTTKDFLCDLVDLPKLAAMVVCIPGSREFRNVIDLALMRCARVSPDDIDRRSVELAHALGDLNTIEHQDLSGMAFRSLRFKGLSFQGTNFSDCLFQNCQFVNCDFSKALLYSARFFGCVADKSSAEILKSAGMMGIEMTSIEEDALSLDAEDEPVLYLVKRFFRRFITERGRNQGSKAQPSFLRGLGSEERSFTQREILPEMQRVGVIHPLTGRQELIYIFDSSWQADGDSLLFDGILTARLQKITEGLRKGIGKYSLY